MTTPSSQRLYRRKRLSVAPEMFLMLLQRLDGKSKILCTGIPTDTKLIHAATDFMGNWEMVLESNSFPEIPLPYPYFQPREVSFRLITDNTNQIIFPEKNS